MFDNFCRNVAAEQKAAQARKELQRWAGRLLGAVLAPLGLRKWPRLQRPPRYVQQQSCSDQQSRRLGEICK